MTRPAVSVPAASPRRSSLPDQGDIALAPKPVARAYRGAIRWGPAVSARCNRCCFHRKAAERLPDAAPDNYLFPLHKIGLAGNSPCRYSTTLISSDRWVPGARAGGGPAKLHYRPHDMRHTFISRLAENPNVSEQTIKALAGHVSRQMLERYSHIRSQAKQAAIKALERGAIEPNLQPTGHRIGHSDASMHGADQANSQKTNSGPGRIRTYDQRIMSSKKTEAQ